MERHILTVDVEDNFTVDELADRSDWPRYEGQVVENTMKILHILVRYSASATFFVVGAVAERHPEIVKHILDGGHEVSSHSHWHKPLRGLSVEEIERDIKRSSEVLGSLSGRRVLGYRAMGYSIPEDTGLFYDLLKENGYLYDSSRKYDGSAHPRTVQSHTLYSVYPSIITLLGRRLVFSGGTYFRLLPNFLIEAGFSSYVNHSQSVMLYVHSWEFNKDQPRRKVGLAQKILQSPLTFTTEERLKSLCERYRFTSIRNYLGLKV